MEYLPCLLNFFSSTWTIIFFIMKALIKASLKLVKIISDVTKNATKTIKNLNNLSKMCAIIQQSEQITHSSNKLTSFPYIYF